MDSMLLSTEMMMFEIVSRTSLKTLDTIRCANKELNTITYNSFFLDLYKKRNNIVSGFIVQQSLKGSFRYIYHFVPSPQSKTIDLQKVLPPNARILASSEQGIIFMEISKYYLNPMKVSYHVCKLTTRQFLEVPNPNLGFVTLIAAIVVMGLKPLRFKIVRLSERLIPLRYSTSSRYYYEIFDSKTQAWRPPCRILTFPTGAFLDDAQEPITTRGSINFLLLNNNILKFDVYFEEWTLFSSPIPIQKYQYYTFKKLLKFERKLGFTCKSPDGAFKIWVCGTNQSWKALYVIGKKEDFDWKSLEALYDSETSVMVDCDGLEFYRYKKGLLTNKISLNDRPTQMFVFWSDFEPIEMTCFHGLGLTHLNREFNRLTIRKKAYRF